MMTGAREYPPKSDMRANMKMNWRCVLCARCRSHGEAHAFVPRLRRRRWLDDAFGTWTASTAGDENRTIFWSRKKKIIRNWCPHELQSCILRGAIGHKCKQNFDIPQPYFGIYFNHKQINECLKVKITMKRTNKAEYANVWCIGMKNIEDSINHLDFAIVDILQKLQ